MSRAFESVVSEGNRVSAAEPERDVRQERWNRLRPRDKDIVQALIAHPELGDKEVAPLVGLTFYSLKSRLKQVYAALDVVGRLHMHALYHAFANDCDCHPQARASEE
jgi:hypothetical protein